MSERFCNVPKHGSKVCNGPFALGAGELCMGCGLPVSEDALKRLELSARYDKPKDSPPSGGLRYDDGKPRVDLLPPDALLELGKVYAYGATKYTLRNWELGMPWSKMVGPLLRHLFKWMMGQTIDEESGQRHIAMVAWNALGLLAYELRGIGTDDRKETK